MPRNHQEERSQGEVVLTKDFYHLNVLISASTNAFGVASVLLEIISRNQDRLIEQYSTD